MDFVITCEHGGNQVPLKYKKLFTRRKWLLSTHRGWDPGALDVAKGLARELRWPLIYSQTTRLLVDLNRELNDPTLFSVVTQKLSEKEKVDLLKRHFLPYYNQVRKAVSKSQATFHLSMHSFTPQRRGVRRSTDIGLLYHRGDRLAREFCQRLRTQLKKQEPRWQVDFNKPYKADGTGIMLALRKDLGVDFGKRYSGIYIEVNQKFFRTAKGRSRVKRAMLLALRETQW